MNESADSGEGRCLTRIKKQKFVLNLMNENHDCADYFYGIKLTETDKQKFTIFLNFIEFKKQGYSNNKAAKAAFVSKHTATKWLYEGCLPVGARLSKYYKKLGQPLKGTKWLSINATRGGLFTGPWITVPEKVNCFEQVKTVLNQLNKQETNENHFGYLLGMLIGDSSKPSIKRKNRTNRRITIRLSKAHESNERVGDFTALCVNKLGLRMKRCKDCPPGKCNTFPFYTWISQSSALMQWIFNACLGLEDNEKTTYDKIKAGWLLDTPKQFKVSFLQGLADSDGFVDLTAQQAAVITQPNTDLIEAIFESLGIKTRRWLITETSLWCIKISINDAFDLPLFNPQIKSYRYEKVVKLFNARRISGHWPEWLDKKVQDCLRLGINGTKIVEKILNEDGVAIRTKPILRRKRIMENKDGITCLGIESTAH